MKKTEQDTKPVGLEKFWDTSNKLFQFLTLLLGIIGSAIALWSQIGIAGKDIKETKDKVGDIGNDMKEVKADVKNIKENLLFKGIIQPAK